MSDVFGSAYREHARPEAISTTKLLGQVMFLVASLRNIFSSR